MAETLWRFHLSGCPAIDFTNTVSWRASGRPVERLESAEDLVRWAKQSRLITDHDARQLTRQARRNPAPAAAAVARARVVREAIYRVFSMLADGLRPNQGDVATINGHIALVWPEAIGKHGEHPVDRFSDDTSPSDRGGGRGRVAPGLPGQLAGVVIGNQSGLLRPSDEILSTLETLDRPAARSPADGVGEINSRAARQVEPPECLCHRDLLLSLPRGVDKLVRQAENLGLTTVLT